MKNSHVIVGLWLAASTLILLACSGQNSSTEPRDFDAGNAGAGAEAGAPEYDSGLQHTDCSLLTVEQCAAGTACGIIEAQLRSPTCENELEAVGCFTISDGCGEALTRARDPEGREWLFRSTCIPHDWVALPSAADPACGMAGAAN